MSPKDTLKSLLLEPVNVACFGDGVFVDVIKVKLIQTGLEWSLI